MKKIWCFCWVEPCLDERQACINCSLDGRHFLRRWKMWIINGQTRTILTLHIAKDYQLGENPRHFAHYNVLKILTIRSHFSSGLNSALYCKNKFPIKILILQPYFGWSSCWKIIWSSGNIEKPMALPVPCENTGW